MAIHSPEFVALFLYKKTVIDVIISGLILSCMYNVCLPFFLSCRYFNEFYAPDFARSGNIATENVDIDAGPLTSFSHSMEPQLRQLGLPTSLNRG